MSRTTVFAAGALVALALAGCAPTQVSNSNAQKDVQNGTLRVWLFSEVAQAPKEAAVQSAIQEFERAHSGVKVETQYIPVATRAARFTAAFNAPNSAPDVAEIGNTDLATYVANGGLADLTGAIKGWDVAPNIDKSVLAATQVRGANYAIPWFVGVRALYYRTDVFTELGLKPPTTMAEIAQDAKAIRAAKPNMVGIAAGGAYQYAAMPYIWANGGELAKASTGGSFTGALDTPQARKGVAAYTALLSPEICPVQTCAQWGGNDSVAQFSSGGAGMTFGGDFNLKGVQQSVVGKKFAVIPTPGVTAGTIAPAFAGGNDLAVFRSSQHKTLGTQFAQLLAGKKYQRKMFDAMGNLPTLTDVRTQVATAAPQTKPFIDTLAAGTKFVPVTSGWSAIDSDAVIANMLQAIATGKADVNAATSTATTKMNSDFAK